MHDLATERIDSDSVTLVGSYRFPETAFWEIGTGKLLVTIIPIGLDMDVQRANRWLTRLRRRSGSHWRSSPNTHPSGREYPRSHWYTEQESRRAEQWIAIVRSGWYCPELWEPEPRTSTSDSFGGLIFSFPQDDVTSFGRSVPSDQKNVFSIYCFGCCSPYSASPRIDISTRRSTGTR